MTDPSDEARPRRRSRARARSDMGLPIIVAIVGAALVVAVTSLVAVDHGHSPGLKLAAATAPTQKLTVLSTVPSDSGSAAPSDTNVAVTLSAPLATKTPLPELSPPVPGEWASVTPTELLFTPDQPFVPGTQETLTVPGGPSGLAGAAGQLLAQTTTMDFTIADGSTLRLQQLLALLGYLPLSFTPASADTPASEMAEPQEGTFAWRWNAPASLSALWTPGAENVITKGAVMAFENQNDMQADGIAGPEVWTALLAAVAANRVDPDPYDYVYVRKTLPETVFVSENGSVVYTTLANTGVPAVATADGTFPVYLRFRSATMTGVNPDGTKYKDPGIPWISYFNGGDALHGYVRATYGWPQSDGCVEMPPSNAAVVWPLTPIGTLVTVQ